MGSSNWRERYPSLGYLAPFIAVLVCSGLPKPAGLLHWEWPIQVFVVGLICMLTWPAGVSLRSQHSLLSIGVGVLVFGLWIAPEVINPNYRHSVLFSNAVLHLGSTLAPEALKSHSILFWRTVRAATVVPIAEELFWRAWLMRWLINEDFRKVPLGAYAAKAFWITAVLFSVEHGSYWDVGLLTGIIYNWWMIRTKSLGDCVLMHGVTNLLMSLYVIRYGQWQYWQ